MTILYDDLLDSSFSVSSETTDPGYTIPGTFGATLDGHPLVIDTKQYRRRTTPATRVGQDVSAVPGEAALNNEVYWTRWQSSWIYGSGQQVFDSADSGVQDSLSLSRSSQLSRRRAEEFWNLDLDDADGIFITDFIETTKTITMGGTHCTTNRVIATSDTDVYWVLETTPYKVYRMVPSTGVVTECTGLPAVAPSPAQLTSDGVNLYSANVGPCSAGISKATVGATVFSDFNTTQSSNDSVFAAHGFLLAGYSSALCRIDTSGVPTIHHEQPIVGTWGTNGWASSPEYIYVVWTESWSGYTTIYKLSTDSTGLLTVPTVALPKLDGEVVKCLLWYQGVMLIGTSLGFRVATIDNGNLNPGPLIEVNRDKYSTDFGVNQFAVYDGKVWFPLYRIYNSRNNVVPSALRAGDVTGVGCIDLGLSVDTLQPAWREVWRGGGSLIPTGIVGTASRLVQLSSTDLTILKRDTAGSHPTTRGSFSTGWITFGIPSKKTFIDVDITHDALTTGQSIEVWLQEEDSDTPVLLGESSTVDSTSPGENYPVGNISSNRVRLIFVLNGDVASPDYRPTRLRRWMLRAYPQPKRVDEILIPAILKRRVYTGVDEQGEWQMDELAEWQHFSSLAASGEIVFYQEGSEVYRVKVDSLEVQPDGWTTSDDGGHYFYNSITMIRLLTLD